MLPCEELDVFFADWGWMVSFLLLMLRPLLNTSWLDQRCCYG